MQGLDKLLNLPDNIRTEIEKKYGSVQDLYQKIFDLNAEEYSLTSSKSPRLNEIQTETYDIEDKLEEFGLTDGSDITTEIASDFGEIIVNKRITELNDYLSQFGTDFDTMREWLRNKHNILFMTYDTNKWIYENDSNNDIRYVLGTKGTKPLLCFGINPSTAKPDDLDNTLKSVERLALSNGFDSWIMMNIYPQRATDPNDMHKTFRDEIHLKNLEFIENILSANNTTIWAAWGTLIEKRTYLSDCLFDIYELSNKFKCSWVTIGNKSKKGHPHHPLYLSSTAETEDFKIEDYINGLKNTIA